MLSNIHRPESFPYPNGRNALYENEYFENYYYLCTRFERIESQKIRKRNCLP